MINSIDGVNTAEPKLLQYTKMVDIIKDTTKAQKKLRRLLAFSFSSIISY